MLEFHPTNEIMVAPEPSAPRRQLTSWKEIAQFFGRSVRTVQDWEKREGLPIHRHRHQKRDSVFAYSEELESWWRQHDRHRVPGNASPPPAARAWRMWALPAVAAVLIAVGALTISTLWSAEEDVFGVRTIDGSGNGMLAVAAVADVDGDRRTDLILHAHLARSVYIFFSAGALAKDALSPDDADVVIRGSQGRGLSVTQTGDFNGDGIADLLVTEHFGEPDYYDKSGSTFIYFGRTSWPTTLTAPGHADVTIAVHRAPDAVMAGCSRGGPSDLNRDGIDDVWLGAIEYGAEPLKSAGAVFVLYGRRAWPQRMEAAADANLTIRGSRMGEGFAQPCVLARDAETVAVFAAEDRLWNLMGGKGALYVIPTSRLGSTPLSTDAIAHRIDAAPGRMRPAFTIRDVNGDDDGDLVAVSDSSVRLWFSIDQHSAGSPRPPDVEIQSAAESRLGENLAVADLDGDGIGDLLLADPGRRQLHLVYGRRDWPRDGSLEAFGAVRLLGNGEPSRWWDVAAGDLDADGLPDVAISASEARAEAGRVWLLKPYIPVRLDVRPGYDANAIVTPGGATVVRVFAPPGDRIDATTVSVAGARPTRALSGDYDADGIDDLQLYFDTEKMRITPETKSVVVRGRTVGGRPIGGSDSVFVVAGTTPAR